MLLTFCIIKRATGVSIGVLFKSRRNVCPVPLRTSTQSKYSNTAPLTPKIVDTDFIKNKIQVKLNIHSPLLQPHRFLVVQATGASLALGSYSRCANDKSECKV